MITPSAKPNFLIIGAQKAASTALLDALRSHPNVWLPELEDPFLRDPVYEDESAPQFLSRYGARSEDIVGLKCPDYLARPEVPARIAQLLGRPRLVVILRNPVERAISAYFWHVRWGALPVTDPSTGLRLLLDGEYRNTDPTSNEILTWGLYHEHVTNYLKHFDLSDMLFIHDQDFREDRERVLVEALDFLGVHAEDLSPTSRSTNTGVYSLPRLRFLQSRNRYILRWSADRSYYTIFKPQNPLLRAHSNVIAATDRWLLSRVFGNSKPVIAADVLERIEQYYRDDSMKLQALLGRSFSGWPGQANGATGRPGGIHT